MPYLNKQTISQYITTGCKRQLRLNLSPDNEAYRMERSNQGMPFPQPPRPGLDQIAQAGDDWQEKKLGDLAQTFGNTAVLGDAYFNNSGHIRFHETPIQHLLNNARTNQFLIEAEYEVTDAFENALQIQSYRSQFGLNYARLRPDIIEVLPANHFDRMVYPNGIVDIILPNDTRRQLRIIDIKLTAKPSPGYFSQVTYYSMVLAGWLIDNSLDEDFVVVPDGALWPGSHDASKLTQIHQKLNKAKYHSITSTIT